MITLGACGMIYEYTFSTLSSFLMGNSTEQWVLTLGIMLFAMALGSHKAGTFKLCLYSAFVSIEIFIAILGAIGPFTTYFAFNYMTHFLFVYYFFIFSIGFLIGMEIPIITTLYHDFKKKIRLSLGMILFMDYFGALLGSLLFAFYLIRTFKTTSIGMIAAWANLIVGIICLLFFFRKMRHKKSGIALGIISIAVLTTLSLKGDQFVLHVEQSFYKDKVIFSKTTPYQHLTLTQHRKDNDAFWLYINGHLQFSSIDEHIYHEALVHPAMTAGKYFSGNLQNVLILGGGDGLALREILKYPQVEKVTLVDLDPHIVELCRDNSLISKLNKNSLSNNKLTIKASNSVTHSGKIGPINLKDRNNKLKKIAEVEVINIDADQFISDIKDTYNIIICDFPDPRSIEVAKLYTVEFYSNLKHLLRKGGVFITQASSHYYAKESYFCIDRTLKKAGFTTLQMQEYVPSFGPWGFIMATKTGDINSKLEIFFKNIENYPLVETRHTNKAVLQRSISFGNQEKKCKYDSIHTRLNPVLNQYYNEGWQYY